MKTDKPTTVQPPPVSYRSILPLVIVLLSIWVGFSFYHNHQTKIQIRNLFEHEAGEMATTLVMGERAMARMMKRLEEEQANRLLAVGFWLRDREIHNPLTQEILQEAAETTQIFNIVLFDPQGVREFGLRGGSPRWPGRGGGGRGQGGRGTFHARAVERFLQEGPSHFVEGLHQSGGFGGSRFSIMVRRLNGGVITLNIDAREQEEIVNQFGPTALLKEFSERHNIQYVHRKIGDAIQERFGEPEQTDDAQIFEVIAPMPDSDEESLAIGFDSQPIRDNDRILFQRMLLSFCVAGFLGFLIVLWSRLQTSYVQQSNVLRQFQSYHQTVLETMEEAVVAWDEEERITFWNPKAEKLFPLLSKDSSSQTIPDSIKILCRGVEDSKETVVELPETERGARRFRLEKTVIQEPFFTHLLFLTDVTAVEEATREHDRREHLEALAKVASGVAHEVRNPLNTIDMTIQTLCMEPSTLEPDDRDTMESLRQEIGRINSIVEHFLAYGRPQPPVFSDVDVNAILRDIETFLEPTLHDKGMRIAVDPNANSSVWADAQQIKQALLNILLNAAESSQEGAEIYLGAKEDEEWVACTCRDRGCGMTDGQMQHIFDPYVTHKPGGTGLGMGIVKRIMDVHQGSIEIESAPGQGTTVTLRFPKIKQ